MVFPNTSTFSTWGPLHYLTGTNSS